MGDAADDAWNAMWERGDFVRTAIGILTFDCPLGSECNCDCEFTDDGRLKCLTCGRMVDV